MLKDSSVIPWTRLVALIFVATGPLLHADDNTNKVSPDGFRTVNATVNGKTNTPKVKNGIPVTPEPLPTAAARSTRQPRRNSSLRVPIIDGPSLAVERTPSFWSTGCAECEWKGLLTTAESFLRRPERSDFQRRDFLKVADVGVNARAGTPQQAAAFGQVILCCLP